MKKEFSKNTTEVFTKALFHHVPNYLKYIDEIADRRIDPKYSLRYVITSEMLMFVSEGKSQRFTETAYNDSKYMENIGKIIGEKIEKIPDAEIYTDVFSKIENEEIEEFQYKIIYHMLRNKVFENSKVLKKYNALLDATGFQKANYEISPEWLSKTREGKTTWNLSMLELKIASNGMAVPLMNEMIRNEDKKKDGETDVDIEEKSEEEIKQDCELNAAKRLIEKFKKTYPRLPVRIIADSLYPSEPFIDLCEKNNLGYIFVMKDQKIPTLYIEFLSLASIESENRILEKIKKEEKTVFTFWVNDIDYNGHKVNIIRQITRKANEENDSKCMWITNEKITKKNVLKLVACAKQRDYIENQGFREQKITSGIDLEHVYSKNIKAIKVIYVIIQITHLILQIIEHSDICGEFKEIYNSVKVFRRKFYAHLTEKIIDINILQIKIQIRFDKSLMIC